MQRTNIAVGLSLIAATLTACGKDNAVDPMAQELADAVCTRAYECCSTAQLEDNDQAGTDVKTCRSKSAKNWDGTLSTVRASEKRGRAALDEAKLQACIATVKSSTCQSLNTTDHFSGVMGCDDFITPKVAAGGVCEHDWECIGGDCEIKEETFVGTCKGLALEGASCAAADCRSGLICRDDNKTCFRIRDQGEMCTQDFDCASLTCTPGADRRCAAPAPPAEALCFYASACSYGDHGRPAGLAVLALLALALLPRLRRRRAS